jgi:hypothetical protein
MVEVVAVVIASALSACGGPSVALSPTATLAERKRAFTALRPLGGVTTETTTVVANQHGASATVDQEPLLVLANGVQVYHAGDLVPLVRPDSPTAFAARRAEDTPPEEIAAAPEQFAPRAWVARHLDGEPCDGDDDGHADLAHLLASFIE